MEVRHIRHAGCDSALMKIAPLITAFSGSPVFVNARANLLFCHRE
jgi:hypothetical protein